MINVIFTADDEEPRCDRCDNQIKSCDWCCENCGSEHWWCEYKRSEVLENAKNISKPKMKH